MVNPRCNCALRPPHLQQGFLGDTAGEPIYPQACQVPEARTISILLPPVAPPGRKRIEGRPWHHLAGSDSCANIHRCWQRQKVEHRLRRTSAGADPENRTSRPSVRRFGAQRASHHGSYSVSVFGRRLEPIKSNRAPVQRAQPKWQRTTNNSTSRNRALCAVTGPKPAMCGGAANTQIP